MIAVIATRLEVQKVPALIMSMRRPTPSLSGSLQTSGGQN